MFIRLKTVAFKGIEVLDVDVQVQISAGMPAFQVVGLPDKAIGESRERVRSALSGMGLSLPAKRITINLSPADIQKEGSHYDLAIAMGLLGAMGVLPSDVFENIIVLGELSLDGRIEAVSGVLPAAIHASSQGKDLVCPEKCGGEAAWASDINIIAPGSLLALVNHYKGTQVLNPPKGVIENNEQIRLPDMRDVKGQESAKRALEVAAAGGHNMLMLGPPGSGKSMLASRLPGILPGLDPQEALEVTMIQSLAGELKEGKLVRARPFRDPHHSASMPALVGGGLRAKPGEISLAHMGVLFLDELPEFSPSVLDALRQPLESGRAVISRANAHVTYPARIQMVAAMNPCRCGYMMDASRACSKAPKCGTDYQSKISGPILDRIDIHVDVMDVRPEDLAKAPDGPTSDEIRKRVENARHIQRDRYKTLGVKIRTNAEADGEVLDEIAPLDSASQDLLTRAADKFKLSARGYRRVQRVARTLADMAQKPDITPELIAEALSYRRLNYS